MSYIFLKSFKLQCAHCKFALVWVTWSKIVVTGQGRRCSGRCDQELEAIRYWPWVTQDHQSGLLAGRTSGQLPHSPLPRWNRRQSRLKIIQAINLGSFQLNTVFLYSTLQGWTQTMQTDYNLRISVGGSRKVNNAGTVIQALPARKRYVVALGALGKGE